MKAKIFVLLLAFAMASTASAQSSQSDQGQGGQASQGMQGNQNIQGTQGNQDMQGTQGNQGMQGAQGTSGTQGSGAQASQGMQSAQGSARSEQRIQREVRHELLMLPRLDVFDNLTYSVSGGTVTLQGDVTTPSLKADAARAVQNIEGVENVINNINVLPPSPQDDRIRLQLYQAIYGYPGLQRYATPVVKPIRIIVNNQRVRLEGVVNSEADKNLAGIRAKGVPGTFEVENNLRVVDEGGK